MAAPFRHVNALIANDARLHGRAILLTQAGAVALIWLAARLPRSTDALAGLVFNLNFLIALLWGDWLISREKLKGTFGWLRTLPVDDRDLVTAKFVSTSICATTLWMLTSLPFLSGYFAPRRTTWGILCLCIVAFAGVSVAVRWRFTQKAGLVVPLLVVLVPVLVLILARQSRPEMVQRIYGAWDSAGGRAAIAVALAGLLAAAYAMTLRWVRQSDTFQLLE
jgi:ABC-type Na+ efflux pump permease subunit